MYLTNDILLIITNCQYQHYEEGLPSSFLVRDIECEIRDDESDDDYLEDEYGVGDDGADDDDDILNTLAIIQYPEDPPSFMRALDIHPSFPNMQT